MKKQVLKISVIGVFLAGSFTIAGCGSNSGNDNAGQQEEKHQHEGHDHEGHSHEKDHDHKKMKNSEGEKSAYICPMKCEGSASEEADQCPECGMDLVKQAELDENQK